jgi:hypothetical protein
MSNRMKFLFEICVFLDFVDKNSSAALSVLLNLLLKLLTYSFSPTIIYYN